MEPFSNVAQKIVLLLEKTRDSLILDLEKEFAGIRKAIEQLETTANGKADLLANLDQGVSAGYKVVDAVFTRIGLDLSGGANTQKLTELVSRCYALIGNLTGVLKPIAEADSLENVDWSGLFKKVEPTFKDFKQLVEDFRDVEADAVIQELKKAGTAFADGFDPKELAKQLIEHILITVLKNGRDVFADEIRYVKLQANSLYDKISGSIEDVRSKVQAGIQALEKDVAQAQALASNLFDQSIREMTDTYNRLSAAARTELDSAAKQIATAATQAVNDASSLVDKSVYEQVADILSKTYAILDFLGIVGQKKVTFKLPGGFIDQLKSIQDTVADSLGAAKDTLFGGVSDLVNTVSGSLEKGYETVKGAVDEAATKIQDDLQDAGEKINDALPDEIGEQLNVTGELLDVSGFGIAGLQAQFDALQKVGTDISNTVNGADKSVSNVGHAAYDAVSGVIDTLAGLSYPITLVTFRWGRIERMFKHPIDYFKDIYPVNSVEDAQAIVEKLLGIARLFNPDIPDFQSLRKFLESVLNQLGEKLFSLAANVRSAFWKEVKPLMIAIRKVIDLLQEMYDTLCKEAKELLPRLKKAIQDTGILNDISKEADALKEAVMDFVNEVQGASVPKPVEFLAEEIVYPAIVSAIKESSAPDPKTVADSIKKTAETEIQKWACGVYANFTAFFSPEAWEKRIDTVLVQLKATFAQDAAAVESLLSGSVKSALAGNLGSKISETFSELDVTQYVDIVSAALNDVSLPKPQLYYEGFRQCIGTIWDAVETEGGKYEKGDVTTFVEDLASGVWTQVQNKIIMPILRDVRAKLLKAVRTVVKDFLKQLLEKNTNLLPTLNDLKTIQDKKKGDDDTITVQLPSTRQEGGSKAESGSATSPAPANLSEKTTVTIPSEWVDSIKKIAGRAIEFSTSDMGFKEIITLVCGLYSDIPETAKKYLEDLLPSLPEGQFKEFIDGMDFMADLENTFAAVTVVKIDGKDDSPQKGGGKTSTTPAQKDGSVNFNASALLQLCFFAAELPVKDKDKNQDQEGAQQTDTKPNGTDTQQNDGQNDGNAQGEEEKKEEEKEAALYCIVILKGGVTLRFDIGKNHQMGLGVEGGTGNEVKKVDNTTAGLLAEGCGFKITKDWEVKGIFNADALNAMFLMDFTRKIQQGKQSPDPLHVFDTQYLSMEIGNYPQLFYLGFAKSHPDLSKYGVKEEEGKKKEDNSKDKEAGEGKGKPAGNQLQVGYIGAVNGALLKLHLQDVAFIKEVIKDDIEFGFDTYLWYDLQKGFDFGGDVRLHMDFDLNHKKLGPVTIDSFQLDAGSVEGEKGKLALTLGTTFQVDFAGALVVAIENLGVGFILNYLNEDGEFGDFGLDASFQFPSGIGITVDATAVKGAGMISIDQDTGEFFGMLALDILKKIGVSGYLLCDPGTAEGHFFSLIVLLSAEFHPGIPLGMGFSLTAIGGTIGLNRQISRDAIQSGVRAGTLDQVFFVGNLMEHPEQMGGMKSNIITYFPAKKGQFFFGLLGQISFEPIVKCDFGLLLQLPSPTEIIIVGALRVNAAEGIVKINVYFAGGINFEEGMWFDASIVDSQIVGISISGDMAFRLNWGGKKGFLLSIGGFHPAYKPEEGLHVGKMNRLAMKLDYSILKISFETYMAVTSNTFQIGARFDLKIGWHEFGIFGYAGFDALFQFDPFLFLFNVCAGVSVKCGSMTLLSIDLSLDVQGPAPWRVAGTAKFKFMLIPVEVDFSKTWGKKTPDLPSKTVEVFPLLLEQWNDDHNWTVDNTDVAGKTIVTLFNHPSEDMIVQPEGSITFNQSSVPFRTERVLEKMDICNDAVPSDYDSLRIVTVNELKEADPLTGKVFQHAKNDFAPTLYKSMSIQEKLESESYVKYNSGFSINDKEKRVIQGEKKNIIRQVVHKIRRSKSTGMVFSDGTQVSLQQHDDAQLVLAGLLSGVVMEKTGARERLEKKYREVLEDKQLTATSLRKRGSALTLKMADQLDAEILEMTRIRDVVSGKKALAEVPTQRQMNTFDAQTTFVLRSLGSEKVKKETMANGIPDRRGISAVNTDHVDLGNVGHYNLEDLGNHEFGNYDKPDPDLGRTPDGGRPDGGNGTFEPIQNLRPFETVVVEKSIPLEANCHRDRASFDRYVAALDRKMIGNKTK